MSKQDDHDKIILLQSKVDSILGFGKVVVTVCITATLTFIGACWHFGGWLYDNIDRVKDGIKAFLAAKGGGQ